MTMKKAVPVTALVLLFGAAAWYSLTRPPEEIHELPLPQLTPAPQLTEQAPLPAPENTTVESEAEVAPEAETPPEPLPVLTESDAEITQALADIAGNARLADYLVIDQLISRAVAAIDSAPTGSGFGGAAPVSVISNRSWRNACASATPSSAASARRSISSTASICRSGPWSGFPVCAIVIPPTAAGFRRR